MSENHILPEILDAYVLDEVRDDEARTIASHLGVCRDCRETEVLARAALAAFRNVRPEPPSGSILASLLDSQGRRRARPFSRYQSGPGLRITGTVAAALVIFLVGFWVGHSRVSTSFDRVQRSTAVALDGREAPEASREPPRVTFAAAVPDRVAGLAACDTTFN